ncbi:6-phosphogluconolactonase [Heyndrickxia shackletonii]|uniref:6-phosphogluconolactonase n=1 Tax=Heyndrickxia shackletonii TaxID=157838 RepID=A0A0Q3TBJ8_9BACI|nr:MerR family transcriptional regulator [Heyndrickxia shackletonii]KQL51470.1 6-phosphogluconolactonase [Heyndrickxia shackletonii]NEZ02409.1 MerR family transcriptional regulator [Heyndrickxia shackletonii]
MRIGEFIAYLNTTKDTVRHYEDLQLLTPKWKGSMKDYGEKEIQDYQVIKEFKSLGLSLKEIQLLFKLKHSFGCGDSQFINEVVIQLTNHLEVLRQEEEEIKNRRIQLEKQLDEIKELL